MAVISNGTTLIDAGALDSGVNKGAYKLISTTTLSSAAASISFTSGFSSTYNSYIFYFTDIKAANASVEFGFQGSTNGGSSYGISSTVAYFNAYHNESDTSTSVGYRTGEDQASSTDYQSFQVNYGNGSDESGCGWLQLFEPSSTGLVTHFISRSSNYHSADYAIDCFFVGYFNTTSNINAIDFKMSAGNISTGTIKMYGVL